MKHSFSLALIAAFAVGSVPTTALCAHDVAVSQVAAQLGYGYDYLGVEDAVQLTRPGLVVLIRPGEKLIDVNDHTEAVDVSPRFDHNELFISDAFVERLRRLAERYPLGFSHTGDQTPIISPSKMLQTGSIALDVKQLEGSQSLAVSGKAPASVPITLTLKETFWTEIPDVVISRTEVSADPDGHFEAVVPVAPGYLRGGILTMVASSFPRISTASTQLVLKAPNDGMDVPFQREPKSMR